MSYQLPTECLSEIFEYLEEDKIALHSCLLVSRRWCEISVRILWRNIWRFKYSLVYSHRSRVEKAILSTLIACLPNESIERLYRNKIFISTPTSKPPLFNYVTFCKVLSTYEIIIMIENVFNNEQFINSTSLNLVDKKCLIVKEIVKMFMNQISSLNKLIYYSYYIFSSNISFIDFPGTKDCCLANLSELRCSSSNTYSEFFYQLSRICHYLQSISIDFEDEISSGLRELIYSQNSLKILNLFDFDECDLTNIVPALKKLSNTLKKLHIYSDSDILPLSFIAPFSNLQEIKFSFYEGINSEDFKKLQNVIFPKLKILKIPDSRPKPEYMTKFLENNGKYLIELHIDNGNDSLGLSIAKFCPNLKKLSVEFNNDELDVLKTIFNSCRYLESIKVWCGERNLSETEVLESVAKYSPENFCELKICHYSLPKLFSEDLELFFMRWKNRATKKLITLIILDEEEDLTEGDIKIIEKYKNLGVVKKFEFKEFYNEGEEEEESEDRY